MSDIKLIEVGGSHGQLFCTPDGNIVRSERMDYCGEDTCECYSNIARVFLTPQMIEDGAVDILAVMNMSHDGHLELPEPDFRYDDQDTVPIPPHKFENCSEGFEGGQRVGTCTQKEN